MDNIANKGTEHGNYSYGYDALYRLTTTDNPDFDDEGFTYDGVGNRLTAADTTGDWSYNQNNELSGYDDVSYEYDANGNITKKTAGSVVTSYVYSIEDRLTEVWDGEVGSGSLTASYYYDPFGRRLWKEVSGERTYFHYADEGLVAELDATGNVTKSYGYKPGSTWTTDPLFMKQGTDYYFYQNDHLGTPQKLTAINGAVVWAAKYSSFGKADVDATSGITNNLRFPGQYCDQETGLHYNYFRYYDPKIGRYLRVDPIGFTGGDTDLYAYVLNDPVNLVDPEGLLINIFIGAISGGIGGAASGFMNDNMVSAVIGGVSGALIGGLVGTVNPFGSNAAGAIAGSWVAGVIGGFGGGAYSGFYNWATDPCASASDVIGSANEGAIGSGIVGLFTSPFGYYAEVISGSSTVAALATESIGMPFGFVTFPLVPEGGVFVGR
jgi:RHS repeat-associated protein